MREFITYCPNCGAGPEHWRKSGFDRDERKKGIEVQVYRCHACSHQFRSQRILSLKEQTTRLILEGFDFQQIKESIGISRRTYNEAFKKASEYLQPEEDLDLSQSMDLFKKQLKQLGYKFLTKRDLSYKIGVTYPGWWDKNPESYQLYQEAVDKPRFEKLNIFLRRTSPQDVILNNLSLISQKTGIGMVWLSNNQEAIRLIEERKKSTDYTVKQELVSQLNSERPITTVGESKMPESQSESEEQSLYVQHVPACGLKPAEQPTESIESELSDIESEVEVIEPEIEVETTESEVEPEFEVEVESDLLNDLRIQLEAKDGCIERLNQEIVNLMTELNNGGNSATLRQDIASNRAVIADLNSQIAKLTQENEQLRLAANAARAEIEATKTAYAEIKRENDKLRQLADPMVSIAAIVDNLTQEIETKQQQLNAAKLLQQSVS